VGSPGEKNVGKVVEQTVVGIYSTTFTRETLLNKIALNKESTAPFQRCDVLVFADWIWSLRLVPMDFQR